MSDLFNQVSGSLLSGSLDSANNSSVPLSKDPAAFEKVLTAMLLESTISGMSGMSGMDSSSSGASLPIAPLMMLLLEQLLQSQVTPETKAEPSADNSAATAAVNAGQTTPIAAGLSTAEPHGRPVGGVVTQRSHPGHVALDFGVPLGTPVKSTMDGKVVYAGWNNQGYGNLVIIENGPYRTYYAHLSSIPVDLGAEVSAGSVIGLSGSTGNSTGPHVHYEIRKNMVQIDPTGVTLNSGNNA